MNDQPQRPALTIDWRQAGDAVILDVAGEVDLDTAARLRESISTALHEAQGGVCVVDLTDVTYLGSAGLSALVEASREAEARREPLRIVVDANRPVIRPIELTGLDEVLRLCHTVEEALEAPSKG